MEKVIVKTETKFMKLSLRMFDRLLHAGKIMFNNKENCWQFVMSKN